MDDSSRCRKSAKSRKQIEENDCKIGELQKIDFSLVKEYLTKQK